MASKDANAVIEPATEQVLAEVPRAGVEETDSAVERAKEAFPAWRALSLSRRADLFFRIHRLFDDHR
ncbi:MAG TPA: aldehyde dehydrogenase family protein, partial [Solirubrobacterales bacterium]